MPRHIDVGGDTEEVPEYTITIEYDDFLTRLDLDEIIRSIDRIIEDHLLDFYDVPFFVLRQRYGAFTRDPENPEFTYIGIRSISAGSITLSVFVTTSVLLYVARRFRKGVSESLLADEIQRSGRLAGDVLGSVIKPINDWVERYVPKQQEIGGKVKKILINRKSKGDDTKRKKKK